MPSLTLRRDAGDAHRPCTSYGGREPRIPDPTENSARERPRACTPYEIARLWGRCRELKTKDRLELYRSDSTVPCEIIAELSGRL
jgi:hypothetical protein